MIPSVEKGFFGTFQFDDDGLKIENPAGTFLYTLQAAAIAANRTLNIPLITGTDTLAVLGLAQTFTANQTVSASLRVSGTNSLFMGTSSSQEALLQHDGTNFLIDPKNWGSGYIDTNDGDIRCGHIGVADTAPGVTSVILGTLTSTSARQVLNFTLTYTGTVSANAIVATAIWSNVSNTPALNGIIGVARLATANTTGGTINGFASQIGFSGTPALSAGTHVFNCFNSTWNTNGGTHTGGTVIRRGYYQQAFSALSGVTNIHFGGLFNNDVQLNTGVKLILDGPSDVALGDSYLDFDSAAIRIFINGTQEASFNASGIDATGYAVGGSAGATGTFTTTDGKTVTVTSGLITAIV